MVHSKICIVNKMSAPRSVTILGPLWSHSVPLLIICECNELHPSVVWHCWLG